MAWGSIKKIVAVTALVAVSLVASALLPLSVQEWWSGEGWRWCRMLWWSQQCVQEQRLYYELLWQIRLPRALAAVLCGGCLGLAGGVCQGIFRNPLASPSLVGVQSGGSLWAVIGFSVLPYTTLMFAVPVLAFVGCWLAFMVVYGVVLRISAVAPESLVVVGFALHLLFAGLSSLVLSQALDDMQRSSMILRHLFGSFALVSWHDVGLLVSLAVLGGGLVRHIAYALDVYVLGDEVSASLQVSPLALRKQGVFAVSVLVCGGVSVGAGVPFVGLMAPHFARRWVGAQHGPMLITSAIFGAMLTLLCDALVQRLFYPEELEVGILLTILGAPFFLYLMLFHPQSKHT